MPGTMRSAMQFVVMVAAPALVRIQTGLLQRLESVRVNVRLAV